MTAFRSILTSTLAWTLLSFGAVYPWGYWPMVGAALWLGGWSAVRMGAWSDPRVRTLALALAAVAIAIFVQVIPLPGALVARVSPGIDNFMQAYELGYTPQPSEWRALSLIPQSTWTVLAIFVGLSVFLVGAIRIVRHLGVEWLATQFLGLGVGLAVVGVVQLALGRDANDPVVYGFWRPQDGGSPFGPFVNRNHFAGWIVMTLPVVIAYSFALFSGAARPRADVPHASTARWLVTTEGSRALLVTVSALVMGMSLALTSSRSGIAAFAAALAILSIFGALRLRTRPARTSAAVYLIVLLLGAIGWAGFDRSVSRFGLSSRDLAARGAVWHDTLTMAREFRVAGTGLGTYGRAMLVYQSQGRDVMYAQAHNDYLQLAAEGGLLVGIPALVVLGLVIRQISRRLTQGSDDPTTQWIRVGAVAGLVGIAVQSLVEFSLQVPANAIVCALLLAMALHRSSRSPYADRL